MVSFPDKTHVRHYADADGSMRSLDKVDGYCLSTDEKPVDGMANGSWLYEIDTGTFYCFDEENRKWWPLGGGGN